VITVIACDNNCYIDITPPHEDAPTVIVAIPAIAISAPTRIPIIGIVLSGPAVTPLAIVIPIAVVVPVVVIPISIVVPVVIVIPVVVLRCVHIIVVRH
jgi:hypothetical protein